MPKHLFQGKLLVISDTALYEENGFYGFEPVVREIESFSKLFESITWIGFDHGDRRSSRPFKKVNSKKVEVILLNRIGGKSFGSKFKILSNYGKLYKTIHSQIQKHEFIHARAPSHPAVMLMAYRILFKNSRNKRFWIKYAGSWVDKAPLYYAFQRFLLAKLPKDVKVSINGDFEIHKGNFINLPNPCLTKTDRDLGFKILNRIENDSFVYDYIYVGNLNDHKGVPLLIEFFSETPHLKIVLVGGGEKLEYYKKQTENCQNIEFAGPVEKNEVNSYLSSSRALILASKTEGFPKVISEAMNFSCIPIVSDVSSISQIVKHKKTGFLLGERSVDEIKKAVQWVESLNHEDLDNLLKNNYTQAEVFTYSSYEQKVIDEIFV
jgi:glycosyltransferase involved in cell wall biosynthesis